MSLLSTLWGQAKRCNDPDARLLPMRLRPNAVRSPSDARSFLFVPATRVDLVEKAIASGADEVIVDLEDSVAKADKQQARNDLSDLRPSRSLLVRINGPRSDFFGDDLNLVHIIDWAKGMVVPMVESTQDLRSVQESISRALQLFPLVETATGVSAADTIASAGAARIMFGTADLAAELGVQPESNIFAFARSKLIIASASAGLPAPIDGPTLSFRPEERTRSDAQAALDLGMGGKLCIHPSQVPIVNEVFAPSGEEVVWARDIVAASRLHEEGVFVVDGEMVDAPVIARAYRILGQAL